MTNLAEAWRRHMPATTGIVLCGGHSRRMGRPKAWLPFGDEFLLQRVVRIVGEAVGKVIVVAAKDQAVPPLPDFARRIDDHVVGSGPLAGLSAGLAAVDSDCEVVYLSACDVPFLKPQFIRKVCTSLWSPHSLLVNVNEPGEPEKNWAVIEPEAEELFRSDSWRSVDAAVPEMIDRTGFQPLAAAYRIAVREEVCRRVSLGQLSVRGLFDSIPTRILMPNNFADVDPSLESLRNVNSLTDYEAALDLYNSCHGLHANRRIG